MVSDNEWYKLRTRKDFVKARIRFVHQFRIDSTDSVPHCWVTIHVLFQDYDSNSDLLHFERVKETLKYGKRKRKWTDRRNFARVSSAGLWSHISYENASFIGAIKLREVMSRIHPEDFSCSFICEVSWAIYHCCSEFWCGIQSSPEPYIYRYHRDMRVRMGRAVGKEWSEKIRNWNYQEGRGL